MTGPGRGHQLIHSDAFAAELEAMGLDQSIFGPHLPAPIFQALVPRKAGVFDEHAHTFGTGDEPATFARASDGIYLDADGDYKVATAAAIRAEYDASGNFLGYLFEPAITNLNTNYNANPDAGLSNIVANGNTVSRVSAPLDLLAAGLTDPCSDGNVIQIENATGAPRASWFNGTTSGTTDDYTVSLWCNTFGDTAQIGLSSSASPLNISSTTLQRSSHTEVPALNGRVFQVVVPATGKVQLVLNQLEQLPVVTSPIITLGATGTRAIDTLSWATVPAGFSNDSGVALLDVTPHFAVGDMAALNYGLVTITNNAISFLYMRPNGANCELRAYDGTNLATALFDGGGGPTNGSTYRVAARWNSTTGKQQVGIKNGTWSFGSEATYDGIYNASASPDRLQIALTGLLPMTLKNVAIFNRDIGSAEITRLF